MDMDMDIDNQLELLKTKYKVLKDKTDHLEELSREPDKIRGIKYDQYWTMIEDREYFINIHQEYINKNMDLLREKQETTKKNMDILEEQQELIDKINKLYDEMKKKLNENKTGSLQGLMRQSIKENNMSPNEGDEVGRNVLDQPYDEGKHLERIRNNNIGGKKKRIKNKTYKKRKNKNKNKKSRRFIRNK